jgi:hypothetical protein
MENDDEYGGSLGEELFGGISSKHIEADIESDLWEKLTAEFSASGWSEAEGIRFALSAGLSFIKAERIREEVKGGENPEPRIEQVLRERSELDGRYAVMKYRCYQFLQDARTYSMKLNACKGELERIKSAYQDLRKQLNDK